MADEQTTDTTTTTEPEITADMQQHIDAAVEAAKAGLVNTNSKLKTEKQQLRTQFDELSTTLESLGGTEGVERLQLLKTSLEESELGKLLTEGKHDEWFEKKTERQRADHVNQLEAVKASLETMSGERDQAIKDLHSKVLSVDVLASCGVVGVQSSATKDVERAAREDFSYDAETKRLVMRDAEGGVVIGKDGTSPLGLDEWLEGHKKTSPHWFPPSKTGGATGSETPATAQSLMDVSFAEFEKKRQEQGAPIHY